MRSKHVRRVALMALLLVPGIVAAEAVRVVARRANVRQSPDLTSRVLVTLEAGTILQVEEREGDWYRVRLDGSEPARVGYVSATVVVPVPEASSVPAAPAPTAPTAPPAPTGIAIDHSPVDCVVADQHPKLEACFNPSQVSRARLHFRADGGEHWYSVPMEVQGSCYTGILPKPRKSIKKVNYYIDVVDPSFAESRTQEYAPDVVAGEGACRDRLLAAFVSTASVVVSAAAGAPALPAGFSAAGLVAAGSGTAAASGGTAAAGGAGGGAAGGLSATTIGLVAGGAALAVGGVALAAGGGDEPDPTQVDNDGDGLSEAQGDCNDADRNVTPSGTPTLTGGRFEAPGSTCPEGNPSSTSIPIIVDARNNGCGVVTVNSATVVFTVTDAMGTIDTPGEQVTLNEVPFTPNTLAPGTATSVRLNLVATCFNPPGGDSGFTELSAQVTLQTSSGPIAVEIQGRNRVNFPLVPGGPPPFPAPGVSRGMGPRY